MLFPCCYCATPLSWPRGGVQLREMGKPNKKLGKYATVSVKLGHVSNKPMWSETKGAGYRNMRESFTVIERTVDIVGGKEKVSLILTHAEHDGKTFTAAPGMCRLLRAGPPNMRFCDAPSAAAAPAVLPATVTATMPAQVPVQFMGDNE